MALLTPHRARRAGLAAIPGDTGLPIVNHNLELLTGAAFTDMGHYHRYGELYFKKALGTKQVTAMGPDAAAAILLNRDKAFASGPAFNQFVGPFFQRGLLLLDFEEHLQNRHIMQRTFGHDSLIRYLSSMTPVITDTIDGLSTRTSVRIRLYPVFKQLGMDIATRTFMGEEIGGEGRKVIRAFEECLAAIMGYVRYPIPGTAWNRGLRARRSLEQYLGPRIKAARGRDGDDLLTALCNAEGEAGERFTDEDIVNHMIFLFLAAHDTSTTTMAVMSYYLAKHPEWQERCRAESLALGADTVTFADLDKLPSLDLVFKEALRLVVPVPGFLRMAVKDTEVCGHFVPKGTPISVSAQLLHRNPSIWTNPDSFDPERFAEPRREDKIHRHAYLPFGGGVHKCIGMYFGGMEVKAVLHQLLTKYDLAVPESYVMPISWKGLPSPQDGLPVKLRRR